MKIFLCKAILTGILLISISYYLYGEGDSVDEQSCVNSSCHAKIIDAKWVHVPAGEKMCDACHEIANLPKNIIGAHKAPLISKGNELCFSCHSEIGDKLKQMPVIHKVVNEDCGKCHNPHSSPYKFQLVKEPPNLCFDCHKKIEATIHNEKHKPIKDGKCLSCHDPHLSSFKKLLLKGKNSLCKSCHKTLPK